MDKGMRGLYAIIDPQSCPSDPIAIAERVLMGGCAALQLRDKLASDSEFLVLGRQLSARCRCAGVPFIVNDRYRLAAELEAAGVHVGQTDATVHAIRRALGPGYLIGVSTHSLRQAQQAERDGANMIGFGPVFATRTKLPPEPSVGLEALAAVCEQLSIPVVAIGGVTLDNARAIATSGASMGAAISALCAAADPEATARALHAQLCVPQC